MIDIHSHILPGVDDGAGSIEESIEIVQELVRQGVTDIIATPHYITDTMFVSPRKHNAELLMKLQSALADAGVEVNLYLGNEIFIDREIEMLIRRNIVSTLDDSEYILVEFSLNEVYPNYEDIMGSLMEQGGKVILAHPERYTLTQEDYGVLENLCEMGVLLQCNLNSFLGKYGKAAEKLAIRLAKERRIFAFGSDIHHARGSNNVLKGIKKLRKYYSESELEKVLVKNPRKIIA